MSGALLRIGDREIPISIAKIEEALTPFDRRRFLPVRFVPASFTADFTFADVRASKPGISTEGKISSPNEGRKKEAAMLRTKVKVSVLKAKLEERLAELKAERPKVMATHRKAVGKWREELCRWLRDSGPGKVAEFEPSRHLWSQKQNFCDDSPKPPDALTIDQNISDIESAIRHLEMSEQEVVTVTTVELDRYLHGKSR